MTREEQIQKAAEEFADNLMTLDDMELYAGREGFIEGANFALEHLSLQWREITLENVDEVYAIPEERLVIAFRYDGHKAVYMMCSEMNATRNTMAKLGGYYYLVLPEMK